MVLKLLLLVFVALVVFRGPALLGAFKTSRRELKRARHPVKNAKDITPKR